MTEDLVPQGRASQAAALREAEPYLLFDRMDDAAVLARLRGQAIEAYVYSFPLDGKTIYGIGIDGAEACKRELARSGEVIEEEEVGILWQDEQEALMTARASRWAVSKDGERVRLDTAIGNKRQEKMLTRRDGKTQPDQFWFEKGTTKCMRNAVLKLIPEEIKVKVIDMYKRQAMKASREDDAPPASSSRKLAAEDVPTPGQGVITANQVKRLNAIATGQKWSHEQVLELVKADPWHYESTADIRVSDYDRIIDVLRGGPEAAKA